MGAYLALGRWLNAPDTKFTVNLSVCKQGGVEEQLYAFLISTLDVLDKRQVPAAFPTSQESRYAWNKTLSGVQRRFGSGGRGVYCPYWGSNHIS